ncbi:hypothetical protein [Cohnella sp.]|uniref:hypothetical protein n=1 Tax=Cohnella sp. TaxID=1883426 RepID=UPI00356264DF
MKMKSSKLPIAYGIVVIAAVLLMLPKYAFNDPDTFWHIELGSYMIEHKQVLYHAIHTFYEDKLPYIPHEFGFQIVLALFYQAFGWPGAYLLTALSLLLLIPGLLRLARVSRKELGMEEDHPLLLLIALLAAVWIYYGYFKIRPQMISAGLIVWFVVYLREFQLRVGWKPAVALIGLSLLVANVHTGVWLVIAVFTGMALLESLLNRELNKPRIFAFLGVWLVGLLNPGGFRSLFFILTVTKNDFNMLINEWHPISFNKLDNLPIMLLLLFFVLTLPYAVRGKPFRFFLAAGILYLGVANFKQNLFMWLLIPYFAAAALDAVPRLREWRPQLRMSAVLICLTAGLVVNSAIVFVRTPQVNAEDYPVDEMNYIMARTADGDRPKVLSTYGTSGYVMSRGGDILTDGRQDPFITADSKGTLGWTAFERSMHGFSVYLPEIVSYDQPDYVIVRRDTSWKLYDGWVEAFGEPSFKGTYGSVFVMAE